MKLLHRNIDRDGRGSVTLMTEEDEDMWHAYNLIHEGDYVRASTIRKVQQESATGSSTSSRVRTTLTIRIEDIYFDTQGCMLRLKGTNSEENQFVKMNAHHTLELEHNRKFMLIKSEWDSVSLERVEQATDPTQNADLAAVIMQEGLANICLVTNSMTLVRTKIDMPISRKRKGTSTQHDKSLQRFFDQVLTGIIRHVNFDVVRCVVIASPGFVKDQFEQYMMQEAGKMDATKVILENKSKFVFCHSSSGFKHSLRELLSDPTIINRLSDTKAGAEIKALETFYTLLRNEPAKAFYGFRHVEKANESQAIEVLLISDNLFRSNNIAERKRYVALVDSVRENGGEVKIFSSLHVSGEQLAQLSGVAALLRFPMLELEDLDSDDENEDQ